jgi:pimeloyl-ACP methyl ester carboxylesterase
MSSPVTSDATREAHLHDGTRLTVTVIGEGPPVLLPVRAAGYPPDQATEMERWGGDPNYGPSLIEGLSDRFSVIAADYEGHRLSHPAPNSLTPTNLADDLLAIADAAAVDRFAYYGYSWLALAGLQLALRTDRLTALVMGGFPPLNGPYDETLAVTRAADAMAAAGLRRKKSRTSHLGTGTTSRSRRIRLRRDSSSPCTRLFGTSMTGSHSSSRCQGCASPGRSTTSSTDPAGVM